MAMMKRVPAKGYAGVFFIEGTAIGSDKAERIYYIRFKKGGKLIEEKAGRSGKPDSMTPAGAAALRAQKMKGIIPTNAERRAEERAAKAGKWTFNALWAEWMKVNAHKRGAVNDDNRFRTHLQRPFGSMEPKAVTRFDVDRLRVGMLKGTAPRAGRKFDPNAKTRADYSDATRKKLAVKAEEREMKREKKPYAVGTVVSVLSLLRRIASFGASRGLCEGLSFKVQIPKGAKEKTEDMTAGQMSAYIKTCREWSDAQAGNFQLLMLHTGMRRGEVRNLKWSDVDSERGFILLRDPKGGEDVRIPMSDAARELLAGHTKTGENPFVFSGEKGAGPRGIRQIAESSRAIRDAAGLPKDFRPCHSLRHTFASHLASSGQVDIYTLSKLLTHKSPTTSKRYAHLTDAALLRGANVMGQIIGAAAGQARKEETGE